MRIRAPFLVHLSTFRRLGKGIGSGHRWTNVTAFGRESKVFGAFERFMYKWSWVLDGKGAGFEKDYRQLVFMK